MKVAKRKAEEMKFQLFLKENDNKRQRAVKRAADESKERAKKEEERVLSAMVKSGCSQITFSGVGNVLQRIVVPKERCQKCSYKYNSKKC